jgi:hypothetical protein
MSLVSWDLLMLIFPDLKFVPILDGTRRRAEEELDGADQGRFAGGDALVGREARRRHPELPEGRRGLHEREQCDE